MYIARVPAVSPLRNPLTISTTPPATAQAPMTSTSTSAVGADQDVRRG
jgi:hypothetical protein